MSPLPHPGSFFHSSWNFSALGYGKKIPFPVLVITIHLRCVSVEIVFLNVFPKLAFRLKGFLQEENKIVT